MLYIVISIVFIIVLIFDYLIRGFCIFIEKFSVVIVVRVLFWWLFIVSYFFADVFYLGRNLNVDGGIDYFVSVIADVVHFCGSTVAS